MQIIVYYSLCRTPFRRCLLWPPIWLPRRPGVHSGPPSIQPRVLGKRKRSNDDIFPRGCFVKQFVPFVLLFNFLMEERYLLFITHVLLCTFDGAISTDHAFLLCKFCGRLFLTNFFKLAFQI